MKIQIRSEDTRLTLYLPTNLLLSRGTVWLANHVGRKYAGPALETIPPQALGALFAELRRIKKKYGHWVLVETESADGEYVCIQL